MSLALKELIQLLELLFVVGCCGSVVVILLSGVEDIETIVKHEEEPAAPAVQVEKQG